MNKNAPKIILAAVFLVAALGLILWNMGLIGGGSTVATEAPLTQEEIEKENAKATPGEDPGALSGLTKDSF